MGFRQSRLVLRPGGILKCTLKGTYISSRAYAECVQCQAQMRRYFTQRAFSSEVINPRTPQGKASGASAGGAVLLSTAENYKVSFTIVKSDSANFPFPFSFC